jgi:hypothetical protein
VCADSSLGGVAPDADIQGVGAPLDETGMRMDQVFKMIIYEVARQIGAKVVALHLPDVTPNFRVAELQSATKHFYVLCSNTDTWAFSRFFEPHTCRLEFEDVPEAADVLRSMFGKEPMSKSDLEAPFRGQPDLSGDDIKYWKPATRGDVLFNWWD